MLMSVSSKSGGLINSISQPGCSVCPAPSSDFDPANFSPVQPLLEETGLRNRHFTVKEFKRLKMSELLRAIDHHVPKWEKSSGAVQF